MAGGAFAGNRTIYIKNSSQLPDAVFVDALPAFQAATDQDFEPEWNAGANLVYVGAGDVPAGGWSISLVDHPDCMFCAGFHDVDAGVPVAQVGVDLTSEDGAKDWQVTFTHELFELLADPFINRGMSITTKPGAKPKWFALEVGDPVEANRLAYPRTSASGGDVWISDFITEAWFRRGSHGPWDFRAHTKRPLQVLKDGYQLVWTGWAWGYMAAFKIPRD